jgi:hypothetical protein
VSFSRYRSVQGGRTWGRVGDCAKRKNAAREGGEGWAQSVRRKKPTR